jgi:hypothetical protein
MSIELDKDRHVYINTASGETYTSVTNFISRYKKPFDKDFWSKKIAAREGVDPSVILDTWKNLTQVAQDRGTNIHAVMEDFFKTGVIEAGHEELIESFNKQTANITKKTSKFLSESILYLHDHKLAGTTDLIIENHDVFYVLDFKTNKKFNFHSKYNEYFLEPLNYLQQCEFTGYTLQLSIYAYMHENITGKKCGGLKIFYLRESDVDYWQEINCVYMRGAVEDMLKHKSDLEQQETSHNIST